MNLGARFNASRHIGFVVTVLVTLLFATLPQAKAATITINSSSAVTFLDSGSSTADFSAPFTTANFTSAQTGTAASVLASTPFYVSSLVDGPGAVWIGTNSTAGTGTGDTALYAVSFNLASAPSTASFNLYYAIDNLLGESNAGIYINGTALPSSTGLVCSFCLTSFDQENQYTDANIASLLVSGTNWLYFDAVNQGAEAGLIFSANITTGTAGAIPEPSSLLLLGTGLLGVGITAFRRRTTTTR
jgi:hypothetical protein